MSETVSRGRDASRQADTRAAAGMSVPAGPEPGRGGRRRRRRVLAGGVAVVVAAGGGGGRGAGPVRRGGARGRRGGGERLPDVAVHGDPAAVAGADERVGDAGVCGQL